jgi:ABC-2 type transport system permease protein
MRVVRDTIILTRWHLAETFRNPIWLIVSLFQPICWLLLFAPLLEGMTQARGLLGALSGAPTSALQDFTPGLLVMMAMFGTLFAGFGIISQLREGFIERLRVSPVSRLALPLSYVLSSIANLVMQLLVLTGLAALMGVRPDPAGFVLTLGLLVLVGVMLASISYTLGLLLKDEDALASTINFFNQPILLLSGVILPMTFAPTLLRTIAEFNPLTHAVEASRALMNGQLANTSIIPSFTFVGVLAALALWWAMRVFRQATA